MKNYSMNFEEYSLENDLVGKFRMGEGGTPESSKEQLLDYLSKNHQGPMTKSGLLEYTQQQQNGIPLGKRVKRMGRDKDDVFWAIGKVHGLENIAYLSDEQLAEIGNCPIKLQEALNKVEPTGSHHTSFESMLDEHLNSLDEYKSAVERQNFVGSDRKKMLAMPFALAKRTQDPEPKKGQFEWKLFEEVFGLPWDKFDGVMFDPEEKITEFEYEKFIPQAILKTMDTDS